MAGVRADIAKLGGPWSDTMLWYARAVGELRTRPLNDRTSWSYLAAIHGIDLQGWLDQGILGIRPSTPATPSPREMRALFNQCQHAGWFFLPWHRGYLHAFEAILADWITSQGGPSDWALPYWNYLNAADPNARKIPQEFLDPTLPDGSINSLSEALRGPAVQLGRQPWIDADITLDAQANNTYTAIVGTLGYGGSVSGFAQQSDGTGANEMNPHNFVHVMVGGGRTGDPQGWMWDPNFAALDPIFWAHHCNIDRLWAAWMTHPANSQEVSAPWKNGPFPRQFRMPDPSGGLAVFVPGDTLPGARLEPKYDNLVDGTGIVPPTPGGPAVVAATPPIARASSLAGANEGSIDVGSSSVRSRIAMVARPASVGAVGGERVYLNLEGVKGSGASGVLSVTLTVPGGNPANADPSETKTFAFFGLANATSAAGPHAGSGVSATVDITDVARRLQADGPLGEIEAHVAQPGGAGGTITVDRISIYVASGG